MSADTLSNKMDNLIGKAYKAASENKPISSKDLFDKAEAYAFKIKNWRGLLDIANACAVLGPPKDAPGLIRKAAVFAAEQDDWRGLIACGYYYLPLSSAKNNRKYARDYFTKAAELATSTGSPRGLTVASIAFFEFGDRTKAAELADKAASAAKKNMDASACLRISKLFQRLGNMTRAQRIKSLGKHFKDDKSSQTEELKENEKRDKRYFKKYWTYYGQPFSTPKIAEWGNYYLRYFRSNGKDYIYSGM